MSVGWEYIYRLEPKTFKEKGPKSFLYRCNCKIPIKNSTLLSITGYSLDKRLVAKIFFYESEESAVYENSDGVVSDI